MSRVGKQPVPLPSGVAVEQKDGEVHVKGPKGSVSGTLPRGVTMEIGDAEVRFVRAGDDKPSRALHGLARGLVANMVAGVTDGFSKELSIVGVGYRAEVTGQTLKLSVGYSRPVEMKIPAGLKVSVGKNTEIKMEGIDRQLVGQFAADVRSVRPPEPYKGKGIRYTGENVRRKVGKTGTA